MAEPTFDKNKFDLGYFLAPKKQDTWKALKYGLTFCLIIGVGYLIFRGVEALFPKPPKQEQIVKVAKGGTATFIQQAKERKTLIPFIEASSGVRTDTKGEGRVDVMLRTGIRFEF